MDTPYTTTCDARYSGTGYGVFTTPSDVTSPQVWKMGPRSPGTRTQDFLELRALYDEHWN